MPLCETSKSMAASLQKQRIQAKPQLCAEARGFSDTMSLTSGWLNARSVRAPFSFWFLRSEILCAPVSGSAPVLVRDKSTIRPRVRKYVDSCLFESTRPIEPLTSVSYFGLQS
jgi:hypothetical protein